MAWESEQRCDGDKKQKEELLLVTLRMKVPPVNSPVDEDPFHQLSEGEKMTPFANVSRCGPRCVPAGVKGRRHMAERHPRRASPASLVHVTAEDR